MTDAARPAQHIDWCGQNMPGSRPFPTLQGLAPAPSSSAWRDEALCAQTDPESFFPDKGGSTREAKELCALCPVQPECLEFAVAHDERFGVWGGLSERDRRRLARRPPHRPPA